MQEEKKWKAVSEILKEQLSANKNAVFRVIGGSMKPLIRVGDRGVPYPNPFNPETTINYQLAENCKVTIRIYNLLGKEIRELVNENKQVGYFDVIWDGKDSFGSAVSSGIYIIQIQAATYNEIRKATILR